MKKLGDHFKTKLRRIMDLSLNLRQLMDLSLNLKAFLYLDEWQLVPEPKVDGLEVDDVEVAGHLGVGPEGPPVLPDQLYRPDHATRN